MILAIETSTTFASVAILEAGETRAALESEARTHSERLIDLIDRSLALAETTLEALDGIAVGVGPGSFTGLRIGMATAKGLCFATTKPMWAVSSLAALALEVAPSFTDRALVPVLDARRKEVFAGFYQCKGADVLESLGEEIVVRPAELVASVRTVVGQRRPVLFGDGAELYASQIGDGVDVARDVATRPSAVFVARLAAVATPEISMAATAPVYIRKSEAEIRYPDGNPGGSYAPIKKGNS